MKKYGFLFGAGAEVGYNLPLGGQFALDIFREGTTKPKEDFKEMRDLIDINTDYARTWLPNNFKSRNVDTFRKTAFQNIIMSTLEHNRKVIIKSLNEFDNIAQNVINENHSLQKINVIINNTLSKDEVDTGGHLTIEYNHFFEKGNELLKSNYFSKLMSIYKEMNSEEYGSEKKLLKSILFSIMELQLGALSKESSCDINDNIFKQKDDSIDFLEDFGELLFIDYAKAGETGLELLINTPKILEECQENNYQYIVCFAYRILETVFSGVLDYKSLIDTFWHYLYSPSSDWAKFCKISIFLLTVHQYISKLGKNVDFSNSDGYYDLLKRSLKQKDFEATAITTTNYTDIIEQVLGEEYSVTHFNGSTAIWYDPYLNKIGTRKELNKDETHLLVPLLFTQSGTKPMTSINMAVKYVDVYNKWKESDAIVVVGFGFRTDDEHIINILRTLINDDGKQIIVVTLEESNLDNESIAKKLKICNKNKIDIIAVDRSGKIDGKYWTEKLCNR